jgi:hypothetical protein
MSYIAAAAALGIQVLESQVPTIEGTVQVLAGSHGGCDTENFSRGRRADIPCCFCCSYWESGNLGSCFVVFVAACRLRRDALFIDGWLLQARWRVLRLLLSCTQQSIINTPRIFIIHEA